MAAVAAEVPAKGGGLSKKGWLFKWTNYLKGYQRRWFVLENGLLSYYRNPSEMSHTCRGTISLHGALIHTVDPCTFVVSNGGTQTFHIKAATEVERQEWVTTLELAKAKAIQAMESEEEDDVLNAGGEGQKGLDGVSSLKELGEKLETMQKWNDLLTKRGTMLQRALADIEALEALAPEHAAKIKAVNEKATQFRIAANAMVKSSDEYLQLAQQHEPKWKKMLQHERDQKVELEKMFEQLARQTSHLEEAAQHALPPSTQPPHRTNHPVGNRSPSEEEDDNAEFYDAQESDTFTLNVPGESVLIDSLVERGEAESNNSQASDDGSSSEGDPAPLLGATADATEKRPYTRTGITGGSGNSSSTKSKPKPGHAELTAWKANNGSSKSGTGGSSGGSESAVSRLGSSGGGSRRKRRDRVPDKPNYPLNLWSIMKNCIGKDLSKIPMPVNFSEPLSMLQRLTEDFEYGDILDRASECTDSCEQMAYVAAFSVSSYSTTAARTGKPFNPLLGETFECDRTEDLGWRAISEQVSHHPPMSAQFCEGRNWRCWQEFTMASKFRGKYLQVYPLGTVHLEFNDGKHHYTWRKVTTTVHNIVVGKLWVDQSGETDIVDHIQGTKCHLKYVPYSYFARDSQRKVKGVVMDSNKEVKWVVQGTWDNKIEIAPVLSTSGSADNPVYKTGPYTCAWKRCMPPFGDSSEDAEKYYNFTVLACQLNEMEDGIAPTDSRHRPDQRLMENGMWVEANAEKIRLEEKQRIERRARENEAEVAASQGLPYAAYEPVWFEKQEDPYTGSLCHMYKGEYWDCKNKQDWSRCPKIF
ncbi:hypothetical protein QAD02_014722 [Eretmocerus hayati]|uniref:Uncharacterized protein n=1 Tax=Eretmocerus hayati TaxID=131215 RepID=A0ACC2P6B0_9HYME|nr:hypothetical protein QAD02_014722 [Eretmocerus hayati]